MRISDWSSDVCSSDLHADHHRIDGFEMARVGGQLDGNLLVVARAVHALLAEVVLDVAAALDRALRYIALELAEQLVEVLAGDVHQHVQAAAVGHAQDRKSTRLNSSH